jgi:hypothetical protein
LVGMQSTTTNGGRKIISEPYMNFNCPVFIL